MANNDCIFCKIVSGQIPSAKFYEDEDFIAILDVNPNTEGMSLILTKKHYDSYAFDMPKEIYQKFMDVTKKVAKILEKGLNLHRVAMVMEGMGINHAHIKLYPLHGINEKFKEIWAKDKVFFKKYDGYISTQLGPRANIQKLDELAKKLSGIKL